MQRIYANNSRTESQINFVFDDRKKHASPEAFYIAAMRFLAQIWGIEESIKQYLSSLNKTKCSNSELRQRVNDCLSITPVPIFLPLLENIESEHSFCNDWNTQELVWSSGDKYVLMSWETSA